VLACLGLLGLSACPWRQLWQYLEPARDAQLDMLPWHIDNDVPIPLAADGAEIALLVPLLEAALHKAKVRLVSAKGDRTLSMDEFLVDTMTTAIEWGEIVLEVILPVEAGGTGVSYQKMPQPASGFALVGVAARIASSGGKISMARVGVTGVAPKAYRAEKVEELLAGKSGTAEEIRQAAAVIADEVEPNSDLHASADYRAQMAKVYAARAITSALQRTA